MKKQIASFLLAFCMLLFGLGLYDKASAINGTGLANFSADKAIYTNGQFLDIDESAWYGAKAQGSVQKAVNLGIMNGTNANLFEPTGNITVAQAIKMASVVHSIYYTGKADFTLANPWYQVYIDYAVKNNIMKSTDFSDYNTAITNAEMAYLFANSLPESALLKMNTVDTLPDVSSTTKYADDILLLYRAGVLMGTDKHGSFHPNSKVQRCQAATIIARIALESERKAFALNPAVSKLYFDKDYVYDQYAIDGIYTDGVDNTYHYSYHIPAFNLDSTEATKVNAQIKSYYMESIAEELSGMDQGCSLIVVNVDYLSFENGQIISLLIKTKLDYADALFYKVYNFNKYTGEQISNNTLLSNKGINENTLLNTAKAKMGAKYKELFSGCNDMEGYQTLYNKTISSNNVTMNMPMFLDNDGSINIIATIYSLAGAESYDYVIDTGLSY